MYRRVDEIIKDIIRSQKYKESVNPRCKQADGCLKGSDNLQRSQTLALKIQDSLHSKLI